MVEWPELSELDDAAVTAAYDYVTQLVQEQHPDMDAQRGMLGELVCGLHAIMHGAVRKTIERVQKSNSLLELSRDPEAADPAIVEAVASNRDVYRRPSKHATGTVTVVLDRPATVVIASGALFGALNGEQFRTERYYTVVPTEEAKLHSTDVVLRQTATNRYAFDITVVANGLNTQSVLLNSTQLFPVIVPVGFVKAFANGDFTGGLAAQSNAELLADVRNSFASPGLTGRESFKAAIRKAHPPEYPFASIRDISVIGMGDREMIRDQRGLFPVSAGGCVDIYVRTTARPATKTVRAYAQLLERGKERNIYSVKLLESGVYNVLHVSNTEMSDLYYPIIGIKHSVHELHDMLPATTAAFSAYQRLELVISVSRTEDIAITRDRGEVDVTLLYMPQISELQQLFDGNPVCDVLVRAAIPCFLSVCLTADKPVANIAAVQEAVAAAVNNKGISGRLYGHSLLAEASKAAPDAEFHAISITANLIQPDSNVFTVTDSSIIVPEMPQLSISARTVAMFLDPADVIVKQ